MGGGCYCCTEDPPESSTPSPQPSQPRPSRPPRPPRSPRPSRPPRSPLPPRPPRQDVLSSLRRTFKDNYIV
ncbi:hypothetical protein VNO80_08738 [Phaseolus coccineus]|uniref:Uncharacterized protein n=1 Tax=Phaseolus coccineus TaxID=3886 RepID=A0AAN9RBV2_PHACN